MKEYNKYFETIEDEIPDKILENYGFHDCEIISIENLEMILSLILITVVVLQI